MPIHRNWPACCGLSRQASQMLAVVALLGADDLARRLGPPGGEQFAVAIVRADHVQHVGQAVVVVVADVGPEQACVTGRVGSVSWQTSTSSRQNRLGAAPARGCREFRCRRCRE